MMLMITMLAGDRNDDENDNNDDVKKMTILIVHFNDNDSFDRSFSP